MPDTNQKKTEPLDMDAASVGGARFQYAVEHVPEGGAIDRYVLLQPDGLEPMAAYDPSGGTLPLVFDAIEDVERFREGLAENIAEIIQKSSGMTFERSLEFAKAESTNGLIPAVAADGTLPYGCPTYRVSFE